LECSDQINKVLAEGMTEKDRFHYQHGGGTKEYLTWLEKEVQVYRLTPQHSIF